MDFLSDDPITPNVNDDSSLDHEEVVFTCTNDNFLFAVAHEEMNSRRRNTMEDVHRIRPELHEELKSVSYFGIYDGHGGRQIVDFLETNLESTIAQEMLFDDGAEIEEKITRAFLITDMESKKININTSGATAVISILYPEAGERHLLVANVGDSRAVLVSKASLHSSSQAVGDTGYYAQRLSYDHRAEDQAEQSRIAAAGGFVARNRVLGILAVSRSFGDHGMKDFVTAEPYISKVCIPTRLSATEPSMLIMACDGVWDVFSDEEAAQFLLSKYPLLQGSSNKEIAAKDAARVLVQEAIERGSSDNVTAIIIFL